VLAGNQWFQALLLSTNAGSCRRGTYGAMVKVGAECNWLSGAWVMYFRRFAVIRLGHEARKRRRQTCSPSRPQCRWLAGEQLHLDLQAAERATHRRSIPSGQAALEQATGLVEGFFVLRLPAANRRPDGAACNLIHCQPPAGSGSTTMVRNRDGVLRAPPESTAP